MVAWYGPTGSCTGRPRPVAHHGHPLFEGIPAPFEAMRYHSLVVSPEGLPEELEIIAWSDDRAEGTEIMGLSHRSLPVYGVQFHPESVGTAPGKRILANFLSLSSRASETAWPGMLLAAAR